MLILSLGLPRLFVLCVDAHGDAHVELVHGSGTCCAHDHAGDDDADPSDDRDLAGCPDGGCTDLSLALDTAPMPKAAAADLEATPAALLDDVARLAASSWPTPAEGPPTTGPPRVDRRTVLRKSTVLRL